jgi:hypothetical protein
MSASMTVSDVNQGLALVRWRVAGGRPVRSGYRWSGRGGNFRYLRGRISDKAPVTSGCHQLLLRASLLQTNGNILIGLASNASRRDSDMFEKGVVFSAGAFVSSIVAVRIGSWLYHRSENPRDLIPGEKTMTSPELLLILNAAICGGIAIRVLLFRRDGSRHRWWGGWLAYVLIVVAASVPIRTFYGYYVSADWSEVIIKAVFLAALIKTKGNVVQIFKITRSQHGH